MTAAEIICNAVDIQDGKKDFVVLTMDIAGEQRAEQRLCYRWPVRFARDVKEKPSPGQIVDVSSRGLAILCHADKKCPHPDQLVTVDFSVPHFDLADSFDTVMFNRIGRVCRVDNLSSLVNRVALQFAEPLFFKPGEQDISESDAQQRLQAKAHSISKAEEKAGTYGEALARAEERTRSYAQAKAEAEEKLTTEIEARCKAEANALTQAEKTSKAEATAKAEAMLRAKAQKKAKTEAQKRVELEAEMQEKIKSYTDQTAKIKAEAAEAIAKAKAQAADTVANVKAQFKQKAKAHAKAKIRTEKKENAKAKQPEKETLLKKVDKFITDRDRIY